MTRRVLPFTMAFILLAPGVAMAQGEAASASQSPGVPSVVLRIDPRLIIEAGEVWRLIAGRENPIWPGWDASDTPILFYLPREQDVLINHPRPPEGFVPYDGPVPFPGGRILVRDGPGFLQYDGQNTSRDIEGVRTLVVADALSNLRQQIRGLLEAPRPPAERPPDLSFSQLAIDPYDQLTLIVHEAFHVFQDRAAPTKGADEMLLLHYPVLSVANNVGLAQEGAALAAALRSASDTACRSAAVRWLALRRQRRSLLPLEAVEYENGAEFSEGLAKYTEYRLLETLDGRTPGQAMWLVQGFGGYGNLASRRSRLVDRMLQHMRGEISVNNDPYGTAPLRMRLYYSGMAIGALLDRLHTDWKDRIVAPGVSLTDLADGAISADAGELRRALEDVRREGNYDSLVAAKRRLAEEGRARIDTVLGGIEHGAGTGIIVDYGALETPRVALAFTPFGISVVDADRTIYTQIPIRAQFPDGSEVAQTEPMPLPPRQEAQADPVPVAQGALSPGSGERGWRRRADGARGPRAEAGIAGGCAACRSRDDPMGRQGSAHCPQGSPAVADAAPGTTLSRELTHEEWEAVQLQLPPVDSNHHNRIQSRSERAVYSRHVQHPRAVARWLSSTAGLKGGGSSGVPGPEVGPSEVMRRNCLIVRAREPPGSGGDPHRKPKIPSSKAHQAFTTDG